MTPPLLEIVSLVASLLSIALAIIAIFLSWGFYRASGQVSEDIKSKAGDIAGTVGRLEVHLDALQKQTFQALAKQSDKVLDDYMRMKSLAIVGLPDRGSELDKRVEEIRAETESHIKEAKEQIQAGKEETDRKLEALGLAAVQIASKGFEDVAKVQKELDSRGALEPFLLLAIAYWQDTENLPHSRRLGPFMECCPEFRGISPIGFEDAQFHLVELNLTRLETGPDGAIKGYVLTEEGRSLMRVLPWTEGTFKQAKDIFDRLLASSPMEEEP